MSPRTPHTPAGRQPSRREVMRPAELVGGSALVALFAAVVILLGARSWLLTGIGFGVVFIVALVVTALFVQSLKPSDEEQADIAEQDAAHGGTRPVLDAEPRKKKRPEGH
jgi:hypothetical protein